ncbi:MAG: glycoside hydrolase family 97 catalytic domain-containing protein [Alistipes indistinctus]
MQVGSQMWTKWMHDAVKKCAENQLMVDIHDEYRPTGFCAPIRTCSQEGVRGNEEMPDATNNLILPFTRYVAGPADYTISYYFRNFDGYNPQMIDTLAPKARAIHATSGQQLAMAVVYYSPLQFLYWYDRPRAQPRRTGTGIFRPRTDRLGRDESAARKIGEYITTARRKGDEWFVGVMNGLQSRTLDIPFNFLPAGKSTWRTSTATAR